MPSAVSWTGISSRSVTRWTAVSGDLRTRMTAVHLVTLLEEMPVQETADGIAELRAAELPVGRVVVNMVRPHVLDEAAVRAASGDHRDADGGQAPRDRVPGGTRLVEPLLDQAAEHARRVELEREQRAVLDGIGVPAYELPFLGDGGDIAGLYRLAKELRKQGVGA